MFTEQLHAQQGAERRLDIQEDAGTRRRHMVNAPVPEQRGGARAEQAAPGQGDPRRVAEMGKRQRLHLLTRQRTQQPWPKNHNGQHRRSSENGASSHNRRAVGLHQLHAEQHPGQGHDERGHNEQVAHQRRLAARCWAAIAAEHDERRAHRGAAESDPADAVKPFAGKQRGSGSQQHRHRAHHQRGMAYGGPGQAIELEKKLDGNAEGRGDQQHPNLAAGEAKPAPIHQHNRQHGQRGKQKAAEHHILHAHLVQRQPAHVEAHAPETRSKRACAVAQQPDARTCCRFLLHPSFTVAHGWGGDESSRPADARGMPDPYKLSL